MVLQTIGNPVMGRMRTYGHRFFRRLGMYASSAIVLDLSADNRIWPEATAPHIKYGSSSSQALSSRPYYILHSPYTLHHNHDSSPNSPPKFLTHFYLPKLYLHTTLNVTYGTSGRARTTSTFVKTLWPVLAAAWSRPYA